MTEPISMREFHASDGIEDWRVVGDGVCAHYRVESLASAARLVHDIGDLPGIDDGPPDVDLHRHGVTVRLLTTTSDYYGLTRRDLDRARRISAVARRQGLEADPAAVQSVMLTIDALVRDDVKPFWRAVLSYADRDESPDDLVDPRARGPAIWFQDMDAPRPQRNRIHVDVWVPHDRAEARVAAALAAGGRLIRDRAPTSWTLADAEGNEVDVATWQGRD